VDDIDLGQVAFPNHEPASLSIRALC